MPMMPSLTAEQMLQQQMLQQQQWVSLQTRFYQAFCRVRSCSLSNDQFVYYLLNCYNF